MASKSGSIPPAPPPATAAAATDSTAAVLATAAAATDSIKKRKKRDEKAVALVCAHLDCVGKRAAKSGFKRRSEQIEHVRTVHGGTLEAFESCGVVYTCTAQNRRDRPAAEKLEQAQAQEKAEKKRKREEAEEKCRNVKAAMPGNSRSQA